MSIDQAPTAKQYPHSRDRQAYKTKIFFIKGPDTLSKNVSGPFFRYTVGMMRRRAFLVSLASCLAAVFGAVRTARASRHCPAAARNSPGLVLHKGWILRSDDPRD
jgi:hypothetical protein